MFFISYKRDLLVKLWPKRNIYVHFATCVVFQTNMIRVVQLSTRLDNIVNCVMQATHYFYCIKLATAYFVSNASTLPKKYTTRIDQSLRDAPLGSLNSGTF
mmetsp:Transcript_64277/g.75334  ORF Transcript_64277/g.75334 Transcript_64277/m.75334 type:complete len:101 (-) Transcript_64277:983-1285(-)